MPRTRKNSTLAVLVLLSTGFLLLGKGNCQAKTYKEAEIDRYIEQLTDVKWQERSQAAYELGKIGGELDGKSKVIAALMAALRDKDEVVRLRATFALANMGLPAVPNLIAELDAERSEVRASVIFALKQIGTPAMPMLIKALENENQQVRALAAIAIEKIVEFDWSQDVQAWVDKASLAIPMLTEALRNEKQHVRVNAATAIGKIAEDLKSREKSLSLGKLEEVIRELEQTEIVIDDLLTSQAGITRTDLGFKQEDIQKISQALKVMKADKFDRQLWQAPKVCLIIFAVLVLIRLIIK